MPPPGVCMGIVKERQQSDGVGTLINPVKFLDQDYNLLHQYYLIRRRTFIDDMFPPENKSIGTFSEEQFSQEQLAKVQWIRPTKLVPDPYLFVDGVSRFDFAQGAIGNCWFLSALAALTFQKDIMKNIIPGGQSFQKDYAGIFHFRFWRFGKWVDVVIDDKLPTIDGKLIFVHPYRPHNPQSPGVPNEFWSALLEKAYAKVCGSYADMNMGNVSEALKDFTGGVQMTVNPYKNPEGLWDLIYRAATVNALIGCGTRAQFQTEVNKELENGLVGAHAYTITGVTKVTSQGKQVELVRLFNPWGEKEWKGDWSDRSVMWHSVSAEERATYLTDSENGEFWMSVEDFCKNFCKIDICSLCPDFLDDSSDHHWTSTFHYGNWLAGSTAGGHINCTDSFWRNPQIRTKVIGLKNVRDQPRGPNMLVSLMQIPDKRNRNLVRKLYIGFSIFEVPPEMKHSRGKFHASFFTNRNPVAFTEPWDDSREVMKLFRLEPGEYLIVPHTDKPNQSASFIMGIYSKTETHSEETFYMDTNKLNIADRSKGVTLLRQLSDQYSEINAEQLQRLLNDAFAGEDAQTKECFSLDTCHSIIAMMDISVTGTLNADEFNQLMNKVEFYKNIFFRSDMNGDGILSLIELRHSLDGAGGLRVSDHLLKLMALRYGDASGRITMENFICLSLRLGCMAKIFRKLTDGHEMRLKEDEWLRLTMYS